VTNVYRLYLAFAEQDTADILVYIVHLLYTRYVDDDPLIKYIWASVDEICSAAETAIGLTCSCLPAINALVAHKLRERNEAQQPLRAESNGCLIRTQARQISGPLRLGFITIA
jgi:hypothetical protein